MYRLVLMKMYRSFLIVMYRVVLMTVYRVVLMTMFWLDRNVYVFVFVQQPGVDKERGKYDQYHAYLDKLQMDREQRQNNPQPGMD